MRAEKFWDGEAKTRKGERRGGKEASGGADPDRTGHPPEPPVRLRSQPLQ